MRTGFSEAFALTSATDAPANCLVAILTDGASVSNASVLSALSHVCGAEDLADHPLPPRRPNANPATLQISAAAAPHVTRAVAPRTTRPQSAVVSRPQASTDVVATPRARPASNA